MREEKSCGFVVFTKVGNERQYVLIMEANGNYGFPKGHMNEGETQEQTAFREVYEETGLKPEIIPGLKRTIRYEIGHNAEKEVTFFVGKYENQELVPQDKDILCAKLLPFEAAKASLKFNQVKDILTEIDFMLDVKGE